MNGFVVIFFILLFLAVLIVIVFNQESQDLDEAKKKIRNKDNQNEKIIDDLLLKINKQRFNQIKKLDDLIDQFRKLVVNNYQIPVCRNCHSLKWILEEVIGPKDSFSNKIKLNCLECGSQRTLKPFDTILYTDKGEKSKKSLREILDHILEIKNNINYKKYENIDKALYNKFTITLDIETEKYLKEYVQKLNTDFYSVFLNKINTDRAFYFKTNEEHFNSKHSRSNGRNIPSAVRKKVWERDGGRCVKCGSKENLHFDHIIPYSKGGSNTEKNIQLLCQECNLRKSDSIV